MTLMTKVLLRKLLKVIISVNAARLPKVIMLLLSSLITHGGPYEKPISCITTIASFNVVRQVTKNLSAYPQINVWPNSVEVRIWNHSDKDLSCSGSIFIYTQSNRFRSEFFNRIVIKRSNLSTISQFLL